MENCKACGSKLSTYIEVNDGEWVDIKDYVGWHKGRDEIKACSKCDRVAIFVNTGGNPHENTNR
jgi:hypothetical protein